MLVDINLLPRKERKNVAVIVMVLFTLFAAITGGVLLYLQYGHMNSNIQTLQTKLKQVKGERLQLQQSLSSYAEADELEKLNEMIQWAEKDKIYTVPLLKKLTMLLPERGFITKFQYDKGKITVEVQFDTTREAAYYLKAITDEKVVKTATLLKIVASPLDESTEFRPSEQPLPRYIATYEIVIDPEVARQKEKEGS